MRELDPRGDSMRGGWGFGGGGFRRWNEGSQHWVVSLLGAALNRALQVSDSQFVCRSRSAIWRPNMARTVFAAESRPARYFWELRHFPMLEPQEEYALAKSWCEYGDRNAAHRLVTSHLRLVIKIAKGYRGYGLPISDVISEGNVGLMQALKRFEPEKGFRFATYAAWWIRAAIQEYILRSWSLVKIGTATNQRKLFFNLRKAKRRISVLDEGDMRPDQVELLAKRLGVTEHNVIDMNRRLGGDASLNAPIPKRTAMPANGKIGWSMTSPSQERILVKNEELAKIAARR